MSGIQITYPCRSDQCLAKSYVLQFDAVDGPAPCPGCGTLYRISISVGADGHREASIGFEGPLNTFEDPLCECHHPRDAHALPGGGCMLRCRCREFVAFKT